MSSSCATCGTIPEQVSISVNGFGPQERLPDATEKLRNLSNNPGVSVYDDGVTTSSTIQQCPACEALFLRSEDVEHLMMIPDRGIAVVRLTDPIFALWNLRRHEWDPDRLNECRRQAARVAAEARARIAGSGPRPPQEWLEEAYAWYLKGPLLARHEYGDQWAALPPQAQVLCAIEACAMAVEVWEEVSPKEGYSYCIPEILESYEVPVSICRDALESVRRNVDLVGPRFKKRVGNALESHFEAMASGEFSLGGAAYLAYRSVSALASAAMIDPATRRTITSVENDPLWLPINQALTTVCLHRSPGRKSDQLDPSLIASVADEWWARSAAVVPGPGVTPGPTAG